MKIYLRYLKSERVATLLFALFSLACAYVLVVIFPAITKIQAAQKYFEALPAFMKALIGEEIIDFTTLEGFLTIEYFSTTWLFLMGIFASLFAGALVAMVTSFSINYKF